MSLVEDRHAFLTCAIIIWLIPRTPGLECERFKLLEEQITVGEVALSELFPLCKLDLSVCILPESMPDFFHKLLIGGVHLVPKGVPPQFSGI